MSVHKLDTRVYFGQKALIKKDGKILVLRDPLSVVVGQSGLDLPGGKYRWGKPLDSELKREVREETGIDVANAKNIYYAGIVTWMGWIGAQHTAQEFRGMYAYLVELEEGSISWTTKETAEGMLEWKTLDELLEIKNRPAVLNLGQRKKFNQFRARKYFLIRSQIPAEQHQIIYQEPILK